MPASLFAKSLVIAPLLYAVYLTLQCPCARVLCCHLGAFWLVMGAAALAVLVQNSFRLIDPSCTQ